MHFIPENVQSVAFFCIIEFFLYNDTQIEEMQMTKTKKGGAKNTLDRKFKKCILEIKYGRI